MDSDRFELDEVQLGDVPMAPPLREVIRLGLVIYASFVLTYFGTAIVVGLDAAGQAALPLMDASAVAILLYWMRFRSGLSMRELGWKSAKYPAAASVAGGGIAGAVWCFTLVALLGDNGPDTSTPWLYFVVLPFTYVGAFAIVLAPIWEEFFYRGLLLSCLRERIGIAGALFSQAAIASFLHFEILDLAWGQMGIQFGSALVLGCVCVVARSLYASIACHAVINYLSFFL